MVTLAGALQVLRQNKPLANFGVERYCAMAFLFVFLFFCGSWLWAESQTAPRSLYGIGYELMRKRTVELSHRANVHSPRPEGAPGVSRKSIRKIWKHGYHLDVFKHSGNWGTYAQAPEYFYSTLKTLDELGSDRLILPLVIINIADRVRESADSIATKADVLAWESRYGKIPQDAFIALRTDWSKRWPLQSFFDNRDKKGDMHTPGWSREALEFLVKERNIRAIGQETFYADPGLSVSNGNFPAEAFILAEGRFEVMAMTRLDEVPEFGALIVVAWPRVERASSFTTRVWAILP